MQSTTTTRFCFCFFPLSVVHTRCARANTFAHPTCFMQAAFLQSVLQQTTPRGQSSGLFGGSNVRVSLNRMRAAAVRGGMSQHTHTPTHSPTPSRTHTSPFRPQQGPHWRSFDLWPDVDSSRLPACVVVLCAATRFVSNSLCQRLSSRLTRFHHALVMCSLECRICRVLLCLLSCLSSPILHHSFMLSSVFELHSEGSIDAGYAFSSS